jgi:hypothetical protein
LPSSRADDTLKDKRKIVVRQAVAHLSHAVLVAREETDVEKAGRRTPDVPCSNRLHGIVNLFVGMKYIDEL